MSTLAQVTANRVNAQQSTGPTSVEGKAAVRFNAAKHFIDAESIVIPGEDAAELAQLGDDFIADLNPRGAVETTLVRIAVEAEWFRRRYTRIEAELFPALARQMGATGATSGELFLRDAAGKNALGRLQRRHHASKRDFDRALAELRRLRQERAKAAAEAAKQAAKASAVPVAPMNPPVPPQESNPEWLRSETSLRL